MKKEIALCDICVPHVLLIHAFDPFENLFLGQCNNNPNRDCRGVFDIPPGYRLKTVSLE